MRFPPSLLDEIRHRLPVSQVVSRKVKLKRQGREYAGLSPFKTEKTPSFTVNDQKGFYHCFASGEHGDIFKFVMVTEGLSFAETVERLAKEAGVPLPKPEPRAEQREAEFDRLRRITEASAAYFEAQLRTSAGREAREYLTRRGVGDAEIALFRLGFAPESRDGLKRHLAGLGFSAEEAAKAGMLITGDDIAVPYDRFRHRLMFPITSLNGAVIAFGGRALKPDQQPKYLNSPETPLFHKGGVLFNAAAARKVAYERKTVIVAEGYMDVIALTRAGFPNAVAPLGTALTEDQLKLLWKMADEPLLCFDGDTAGRKAAYRAVDTALPHVKAGSTLRFAFLPDGLDPDDLLRTAGPDAVAKVLDDAKPLIDVLWQMETSAGSLTTPESRAGLEARLNARAASIQDPSVRNHYQREFRSRLWAFFNPARNTSQQAARQQQPRPHQRNGGKKFRGPMTGDTAKASASDAVRNSSMLHETAILPSHREALMVLALLNHPWLVQEDAEHIAELPFDYPVLNLLRDAIITCVVQHNTLDNAALRNQLISIGLEQNLTLVEHAITHQSDWHTQPDAPSASVLIGWRHMMALHRKSRMKQELKAAEEAFIEDPNEDNYLRLRDLRQHLSDGDGAEASIDGYSVPAAS